MTQEDKELLLKDLCVRLPYEVMVECSIECGESIDLILSTSHIDELVNNSLIVKPYLRPMSDMTEAEKEEMHNVLSPQGTAIYREDGVHTPMSHYGEFFPYEFMSRIIRYLCSHHLDYLGLINKGLAIEVYGDFYNIY